jgi:choline kinase
METGVILAAGLGKRLKDQGIKPLASVDDIELLIRTIHSHEIAGCEKVVIVLGWKADAVQSYVDSRYMGTAKLVFTYNERYYLQNGISVLCSRPFVGSQFLLTMADHILDDKIMELVKNQKPSNRGGTLCVDYKLDTIFDMDDATKVLAEGSRIKEIGKHLETFNCIDTGVFIGTQDLMQSLEAVYKLKGDASLSDGVQCLADRGLMEVLDIKDAFWQDVDTPEMLKHAERLLNNHSPTNRKSVAQ